MTLSRDRPEILTPPEHPPACCTQQTITVPPDVAAKTRQKHDYPSPDGGGPTGGAPPPNGSTPPSRTPPPTASPAAGAASMGLAPLTLWIACLLAVRNQRILTAYQARQDDNARRAAAGLPPRTRKRRRTSLAQLASAP